MTPMGQHSSAAAPRRDHLWVLVIIAACALLEVWASWLGIGSVSGFPKLGRMTTGWILPVSTEAYWGYAVWAWLAGAAGKRSRRFAMWSAIGMFTLSLGGQEAGHLLSAGQKAAPWFVVALVTALPLIAVGLAAILVHLRQADREEAEAAEREAADEQERLAAEAAAADERTALRGELQAQAEAHAEALRAVRGELDAAHHARETAEREAARLASADAERDDAVATMEAAQTAAATAETARSEAERQAAESAAKIETLTRKLARSAGAKTRGTGKRKTPATAVPRDFDVQAEALAILADDPGISGAKLAAKVGRSARWGETFKKNLATRPAGGEAAGE